MADRSAPPRAFSSPVVNTSHPDFQAPWIQKILNDRETQTRLEGPSSTKDINAHNLFNYTLVHDTGIRARIFLTRPSTTSPSGREECMIASLGRGLDGAVGRAHGGMSSMLLDHTLGTCAVRASGTGLPMATATLTVDYKNPIGTPCVVLCRAWVSGVEGRKFWTKGTIEDGEGKVFAEGRALFILPREGTAPSL